MLLKLPLTCRFKKNQKKTVAPQIKEFVFYI